VTEPVERDAHRIVAPDAGLTRFDLVRHDPSPSVARFVDRHRIVTLGVPGERSWHTRLIDRSSQERLQAGGRESS
jgi:hypothetical protein